MKYEVKKAEWSWAINMVFWRKIYNERRHGSDVYLGTFKGCPNKYVK